MNQLAPIDPATAIALPPSAEIMPLFTVEGGTEKLLEKIEKIVATFVPDVSTAKGRDAIKAMAFKVTKSKTALTAMADEAKSDAAAIVKAVRVETRRIEARLDTLRDNTRQPFTDWEAADATRKDRLQALSDTLAICDVDQSNTLEEISAEIARIDAIEVNEAWDEYAKKGQLAKDASLASLGNMHASAELRIQQEAELAELRAREAARDERDRIAAAQVEADRVAAAQVAADAIAAVKANAERDALALAEENRIANMRLEEERAQLTAAADARIAADKAAADKIVADEAARIAADKAAADKIAADKGAEEAAQEKRAADSVHLNRIKAEVLGNIAQYETPGAITDAIFAGLVPHVSVAI